ncbi:MAG: flagellar hook protein FlgE [Chloroflexi bacterium]|nr:MAG: flagellar hook protein FlgE [Chloroflexota bacterium]MBL1194833.1 flagellar hook protein FlgE [Chloroflexota bacterium]NOH12124.1 flagellar hook protein FlgE [Chloroflexota bacterium]
MLRSMFTAITSLNLHQTYMDVVADNLANANTPAYKASRITFKDQFAQTMSAGSAPTATLGGINPTQIGLGARLGGVTTTFSQGTMQSTGRLTDMAIQGDGLFIYSDATNTFYSRDGATNMDSQGFLVNESTGLRLQGWTAVAGVVDTGTAIGDIQVPTDSTLAQATQNVFMGGNLDGATGGTGSFSVTVGAYDSLGQLRSVAVDFTRQGVTNVWDWAASSGAAGSGTVTFDAQGQFSAGGGAVTIPASGGAPAFSVNLDMANVTQLAANSDASGLSQDGLGAGSLTGFSVISNTGEVYAVYSNGLQQLMGQVSLATFVNPSGLNRIGQNLYEVGLNSGDPQVGAADTGGRGTILSGNLEASTVDLAQEFTNMILAQRGFQAASRVITASDQMLQELVNIGR